MNCRKILTEREHPLIKIMILMAFMLLVAVPASLAKTHYIGTTESGDISIGNNDEVFIDASSDMTRIKGSAALYDFQVNGNSYTTENSYLGAETTYFDTGGNLVCSSCVGDSDVSDTITVSGGSVTWSALDSYPSACTSGYALTGVGDTPSCGDFLQCADCAATFEAESAVDCGTSYSVLKRTGSDTYGCSGISDESSGTAMTIDSNEQVGIGTSVPDRKLDVEGGSASFENSGSVILGSDVGRNIEMKGSSSSAYIDLADSALTDYDTRLISNTDTSFQVKVNGGTTAMTFDWSGYLGILTTTPSERLEVNGDIDVNNGTFFVRDGSTNVYGLGYNTEGGSQLAIFSDDIIQFSESTSDTIIMTIMGNNGRVGIGTSAPASELEILDTTAPEIRITPGTNTTYADPTLYLKDTSTSNGFKLWYDNNAGDTYFDNKGNSDSYGMFFRTYTDSTTYDGISIQGTGKVGIHGATNPQAYLSVNSDGTADAALYSNETCTPFACTAYGLYGSATSTTSSPYTYGLYGEYSADNYGYLGGYYYGAYGHHVNSGGIYGYLGSISYGAYGNREGNYGYIGSSSYGMYGAASEGNYGYLASSSYGGYCRGNSGSVYAVLASNGYGIQAYGNGSAGYFNNQDSSGTEYGVYGRADGSSGTGSRYGIYSSAMGGVTNYGIRGAAGQSGAGVTNYGVSASASGGTTWGFYCSAGTKSWANPHPEDPTKSIVYVTLEGGEHGAYWRGRETLKNGQARIRLPDHFRLTTSPDHDITVVVTPRSRDSKGLAVSPVIDSEFTVTEMFEGKGEYEFDFMAIGVRRGFEEYEPIRDNLDYVPFDDHLTLLYEQNMTTQEFYDGQSESMKKIFKSSGILNDDGTVNQETFKKNGWKIFEKSDKKDKKWKVIDGDNPPIELSEEEALKFREKENQKKEKKG